MEGNKENKKGEPLLYIDQPNFVKPDLKMQDSYHTVEQNIEEKAVRKKEDKMAKHVHVKKTHQEHDYNQPLEKEKDDEHHSDREEQLKKAKDIPIADIPTFMKNSPVQQKSVGGLRKVKSFREMTIEEKFQYLSSFPEKQPPYPCEFITTDQSYQGIVTKYNGEQASIKTFSENVIDLKVHNVKAIRIIR
ncbi:CotO family spore coat protein [Bacillus sp. FSL K6-3431]|uniref:CotO family spore coat protein n=1 Tax=Bacillus sp. FSL K6-3431 TaxID=2921500 RepID=UPI0030F7671F